LRRALVAALGTGAGLVALLGYKSSGPTKLHPVVFSAGSGPTTTALPATAGPPTSTTSVRARTTTSSARRTSVGQVVQYAYGDIEVSVTLEGTRVVNVTVPQNGAADARSQMINSYAVPILEQEAVAARGLNFNAVSGATFTSDAFAQSLQSALQRAGK
jgi:uncharacterized protein with FMN-binding domain